MLLDHVLPKPPNVGAYASHQLLEGLTEGRRPLFIDMGDHLIVRCSSIISEKYRPVPDIEEGEIRAFELRASCGVKTKGHHRYFPPSDWRARHDWLRRRSDACGFEVLTVNVTAAPLRITKDQRTFMIDRSDFTGVLRVIDADRFRRTLADGFPGPGRAFGNGMLMI